MHLSLTQTRRGNQCHYYPGAESDEDLGGNPPSVASSLASSIRGRPMTQRSRRGRSNASLRGAHHQIDLDDTPHDSYMSPSCRMRQPSTSEGRPSKKANEKKDRKGKSAKPSLKNLSSLSDSGAYVQWKESLNYY